MTGALGMTEACTSIDEYLEVVPGLVDATVGLFNAYFEAVSDLVRLANEGEEALRLLGALVDTMDYDSPGAGCTISWVPADAARRFVAARRGLPEDWRGGGLTASG